jgi:hypothetical protein
MWIVLTLVVYGVLSCAGVRAPTWLIVVDVVITVPLAVVAIAGAAGVRPTAATADRGPDVGTCKDRLQAAGWVTGEELVTASDGRPRCRVAATKEARTVTGEGEALRLAEAEDRGARGA